VYPVRAGGFNLASGPRGGRSAFGLRRTKDPLRNVVDLVHVQFLRAGLTAHLDFALVLPGGGEVISKLHP